MRTILTLKLVPIKEQFLKHKEPQASLQKLNWDVLSLGMLGSQNAFQAALSHPVTLPVTPEQGAAWLGALSEVSVR